MEPLSGPLVPYEKFTMDRIANILSVRFSDLGMPIIPQVIEIDFPDQGRVIFVCRTIARSEGQFIAALYTCPLGITLKLLA